MLSTLSPSPAAAAQTARVLRALANPRRLLILCRLLQDGEASAGELASQLGLAPSALSQHLARMRAAGLVRYHREARTLLYRVGDACEGRLTTLLRGICTAEADLGAGGSPRGAKQAAAVVDLVFAGADAQQAPGFWQTPAIAGAGPVHPLPDAVYQPPTKGSHKLVFAVTQAGRPDRVIPGLARTARAVNLYVGAGVPKRRMKISAVVYGAATAGVLADPHYRERFGTDNPNLPVLRALRDNGVEIAVCGQAIAGSGYEPEWISKDVALALSGITALAELQQRGYALMPS